MAPAEPQSQPTEQLPEIERIRVATVAPGDIIIIECSRILSRHQIDVMKAKITLLFPGVRVLLLEDGMRLAVLKAEESIADRRRIDVPPPPPSSPPPANHEISEATQRDL